MPPEPGVYEVRRFETPRGVLYLGGNPTGAARGICVSGLTAHLRGHGDNARLREFVSAGVVQFVVQFRYRRVTEGWREVARAVYAAFCATFGVPPSCNRMSP